MGIIFETKNSGGSYKSAKLWSKTASRQAPLTELTRLNAQFLQSLGLRVRGTFGK